MKLETFFCLELFKVICLMSPIKSKNKSAPLTFISATLSVILEER